jgi:hypothetical protein
MSISQETWDVLREAAGQKANGQNKSDNGRANYSRKPELLSRKAASIDPQKVEWLWSGRLARGKPGTGKVAALHFHDRGHHWRRFMALR